MFAFLLLSIVSDGKGNNGMGMEMCGYSISIKTLLDEKIYLLTTTNIHLN
jgi:hypothetical protein